MKDTSTRTTSSNSMTQTKNSKPVISLRTLPAFLLAFLSLPVFAQAPQWTDDSKRQALYPSDKYLTGYFWQENVKKKEVEDALWQLVSQAKGELLESITVSVETESKSSVADYGDEFYESFSSKTKTSSGLKLVGLQVAKYYDKKGKKAYGFAYVSRQSLYDHYHGLIRNALREWNEGLSSSQIFLGTGDAQQAIEAVIKGDSLRPQIALGQKTLEVLGYRSDMDQRTSEISELEGKRREQLKKVYRSKEMNAKAVAFQLAYDLLQGFELNKSKLKTGEFSFEGSGMSAPLAYELKKSLGEQLGAISSVKKPREDVLDLSGSWKISGELIEVTLEARNGEGKVLAASKSAIAKANLKDDEYMPLGAKRLAAIEGVQIKLSKTDFSGTCQKPLGSPVKGLVLSGPAGVQMPLQIRNASSKEVIAFSGNEDGSFAFTVDKIRSCKATQILFVEIDLAKYLQLDPSAPYLERVQKERKLPNARMVWKVAGPKIVFEANETANGEQLKVPIVSPLIKEKLSKLGFNFTDDASVAELMITVNASSRNGGNLQGLYFSYCDVEVVVTDMQTGSEILNEAMNGVKEAGASWDQAGMKAFKKVGDQIADKVVQRLND
jgi:hypothetical protein